MRSPYERHHILHERRQWASQTPQRELRLSRGMIVPLTPEIHRPVLHANAPAVPLLPYHIAARALGLYYPHPDVATAVDNMCFAIQEAAQHPKVHSVEHDLANLTIRALEIQRPFLIEGQMHPSNEVAAA